MRLLSGWRSTLLAGALLALAGGGVAPSQARAGCGDGIRYGFDHDPEMMPAGAGEVLHRLRHTAPARYPLCHGPFCSRSNLPAQPVVPPPPPAEKDWSCLPALPFLEAPRPILCLLDSCAVLPLRLPTDIFHPPRLLS
jgi:hypothetical protein